MSELNQELCLKIAEAVTTFPEEYDQMSFGIKIDGEFRPILNEHGFLDIDCGTPGCIAYWACILSGEERDYQYVGDIYDHAQELLGLNDSQAKFLFDFKWPEQFREDKYSSLIPVPQHDLGYWGKPNSLEASRLMLRLGNAGWDEIGE